MVMRVAILSDDQKIIDEISIKLIDFSVSNDFNEKTNEFVVYEKEKRINAGGKAIELDIALYNNNQFRQFRDNYKNIDVAFITYGSLEADPKPVEELFALNPMCFPVLVGFPQDKICSLLALRPAGQLTRDIDSLLLSKCCRFFVKLLCGADHILHIHTRKGDYSVSMESIVFCQSDQKFVTIVTDTGKNYRRLGTLNQLQEILSGDFIRVHQSFLVNSKRITAVNKVTWEVETDIDYHIPVSRPYRQDVLNHFNNSV